MGQHNTHEDADRQQRIRASLRDLDSFASSSTAAPENTVTTETISTDAADLAITNEMYIAIAVVVCIVLAIFASKDLLIKYYFPAKEFEEEKEPENVAAKESDDSSDED